MRLLLQSRICLLRICRFSTIILSRFFVNLREASQNTVPGSVTTLSQSRPSSSLYFSLGIDAFGGTLTSVDSSEFGSDILDDEADAIAME